MAAIVGGRAHPRRVLPHGLQRPRDCGPLWRTHSRVLPHRPQRLRGPLDRVSERLLAGRCPAWTIGNHLPWSWFASISFGCLADVPRWTGCSLLTPPSPPGRLCRGRNPNTFDNDYFKLLVDERWTVRPDFEPLQFEDSSKTLMMLPTDISLITDPKFRPTVAEWVSAAPLVTARDHIPPTQPSDGPYRWNACFLTRLHMLLCRRPTQVRKGPERVLQGLCQGICNPPGERCAPLSTPILQATPTAIQTHPPQPLLSVRAGPCLGRHTPPFTTPLGPRAGARRQAAPVPAPKQRRCTPPTAPGVADRPGPPGRRGQTPPRSPPAVRRPPRPTPVL